MIEHPRTPPAAAPEPVVARSSLRAFASQLITRKTPVGPSKM
jgi:hypothetical protein